MVADGLPWKAQSVEDRIDKLEKAARAAKLLHDNNQEDEYAVELWRGEGIRFERLERWVDAHLGEALTLDRLCAISGVRWRTLQKAVMALRGQSPLEWIAARRLAAVRAQLLLKPADATISRIALDFGFTHLGRFSAIYHQTYGELPSETLEMARSRDGARRRSPSS